MAYNATAESFDYSEGDIAESTINTIVKSVIIVGQLITLIVIVALYNWAKKKL